MKEGLIRYNFFNCDLDGCDINMFVYWEGYFGYSEGSSMRLELGRID